MTASQLEDLLRLPPEERLALIERLWDSLSPENVPVPPEHLAELDRRLDHPAPGPSLTPEELTKHLKRS